MPVRFWSRCISETAEVDPDCRLRKWYKWQTSIPGRVGSMHQKEERVMDRFRFHLSFWLLQFRSAACKRVLARWNWNPQCCRRFGNDA